MFSHFVILLCAISAGRAQNEVSKGIHTFMANIVRNIGRESPSENFVISPFSLHSTFSQALIGAGGRTQAELEQVLGVKRSRSVADQYSKIHDNLDTLKIANMLILNKGFKPKSLFIKFLQDGFGTQLKEYDFLSEKAKSVKEVNQIVSSITNQKITDLISLESIDENLKMMMINAVYFKAKWKESFNPEDSFTANFKSAKGNTIAKFMTTEMEARLDETKNLDILELPYEDSSKSMIIFLPKFEESTNRIIDSINRYPTQKMKTIPTEKTVVSIPKFKIDFELNLKSKMNNMGVSTMFSDNANFTHISNIPLKVSDGIHKAFIEVNEEGTEAAAATAFLFGLRSSGGSKHFFANKPFYFMVYDFKNQIPLFMGKFSNPSSEKGRSNSNKDTNNKDSTTFKDIPALFKPNQELKKKEECVQFLEPFGITLHNNKECMKKISRPYEWYVKNQTTCRNTKQDYEQFFSNNCGSAWCEYAKNNYKDWKETYARNCNPKNKKSTNSTFCLKLESNFKTKSVLSCRF